MLKYVAKLKYVQRNNRKKLNKLDTQQLTFNSYVMVKDSLKIIEIYEEM